MLIAGDLTWLSVPEIKEKTAIKAKVRSSQKPVDAVFEPNGKTAIIRFFEKQKTIAQGQSVVFYDDEGYVLGGGIIKGTKDAAE